MGQRRAAMEGLLTELKEYLRTVEEDVNSMEESGEAAEYPIKHETAREKIEQIKAQIADLEEALERSGE